MEFAYAVAPPFIPIREIQPRIACDMRDALKRESGKICSEMSIHSMREEEEKEKKNNVQIHGKWPSIGGCVFDV